MSKLFKDNDVVQSQINEMSDDENPEYMFQDMSIKLVLGIATGKIDAKKYAAKTLANQGLDKRGKWIGFDKAEKLWKV